METSRLKPNAKQEPALFPRGQQKMDKAIVQPNIQPIRSAHLSPAAQSRALALPNYSGVNFFSLLSVSC